MMFSFIKAKDPEVYKKFLISTALVILLGLLNILAFFYIGEENKRAKVELYNAQEMQLWLGKYHQENIEQTILSLPTASSKEDNQIKSLEVSSLLRDGNNVINISSKDVIAKTKDDLNAKNITTVFNTNFSNIISTLNRLESSRNLLSVESFTLDTSTTLPLVTLGINLYFK